MALNINSNIDYFGSCSGPILVSYTDQLLLYYSKLSLNKHWHHPRYERPLCVNKNNSKFASESWFLSYILSMCDNRFQKVMECARTHTLHEDIFWRM